jgi:site-specific recombinase XerD
MLVAKENTGMKNAVITEIKQRMTPYLNDFQIDQLTDVLEICLQEYLSEADPIKQPDLIQTFLAAKRVEGCSSKTLTYYDSTIRNVLKSTGKPVQDITTDDLRIYLDAYQTNNGVSKVTIDNIRRILSTFFAWLEDENFIIKSPVRRIHKVKTCKTVKETYSDEFLEIMRDNAESIRDLAMIDLLASTGIRVGELVLINRVDVDFVNRECIVLGKGNKQRKVYFDARTKIHLQRYLSERTDDNPALFVTLNKPYSRLQIKGVEIRLQRLGRKLGLIRVHPHKFRRTLATMAIDKGMPIEQVQQLLGHESVDTTLQYAMVNQNNVKLSHHRYIG